MHYELYDYTYQTGTMCRSEVEAGDSFIQYASELLSDGEAMLTPECKCVVDQLNGVLCLRARIEGRRLWDSYVCPSGYEVNRVMASLPPSECGIDEDIQTPAVITYLYAETCRRHPRTTIEVATAPASIAAVYLHSVEEVWASNRKKEQANVCVVNNPPYRLLVGEHTGNGTFYTATQVVRIIRKQLLDTGQESEMCPRCGSDHIGARRLVEERYLSWEKIR